MVDNCYCEFVEKNTPLEIGADIMMGSLIKNLGGGIAPNGGYICGKKDLIHLCSERLNVAGEAKEVGPSLNMNRLFLQGLYLAPSVVASALKTAVLTSKAMEKLGYDVKIEQQGSLGQVNKISQEEANEADFVLLATDQKVIGLERFDGKPQLRVSINTCIKAPEAVLKKCIEAVKERQTAN